MSTKLNLMKYIKRQFNLTFRDIGLKLKIYGQNCGVIVALFSHIGSSGNLSDGSTMKNCVLSLGFGPRCLLYLTSLMSV